MTEKVDTSGWEAVDMAPIGCPPDEFLIVAGEHGVASFATEAARDHALMCVHAHEALVEALALAPDIGEYFNGPHLRIKDFEAAYEAWIADRDAALRNARKATP